MINISKVYKEDDNRPEGLKDEFKQLGIDFDGVIHGCSKGFHDGTIYDDPIEGSLESIMMLSKKYDIVIYSAKARSDRPLINGKTGIELIWDWLRKYGIDKCVKEVTAEKPRAICYIDDRAIRFESWDQITDDLKKYNIL